jgi:hypothetical protein
MAHKQPRRRRRRCPSDPREDQAAEPKVWPEKLIGAKFVRLLEKHLRGLQQEPAHGNRALFLDDVFVAYLLAFFNPSIRSLRTIEDLSQTVQAQKHLSIDKICKSTLSDFNRFIDPERLLPIIQALRAELHRKQAGRPRDNDNLNELLEHTIAVDGTFLPAVAQVAWAVGNSNQHGARRHRARLDAHLNVASWLPEAIVVPEPGESEADSAMKHVRPGYIHLYDRGHSSFALLGAHYQSGEEELVATSHFVVRYKPAGPNSPQLEQPVECPLSEADRAAGIVSDRRGCFRSDNARRAGASTIELREVVLPYEEHGEQKTLRLITNLLDVSADTIALLYRHRWQVELFFRWIKSFGNFGHLISHSREGVQAHLYVTIIAVQLMYLHTGFRPSKYMFALVNQVATGAATLDEILPILRERERRKELDRVSAAKRRAKKQAASR